MDEGLVASGLGESLFLGGGKRGAEGLRKLLFG